MAKRGWKFGNSKTVRRLREDENENRVRREPSETRAERDENRKRQEFVEENVACTNVE